MSNDIRLSDIGSAAIKLYQTKSAADTVLSYGLKGRLTLSASGWLLLDVPNALGNGAFQALSEPGIEQPISDTTGRYHAHISVARPEEIEAIGGPDKIKERGETFGFTLGPVRHVAPRTWDGVSRCWMIEVRSPELMKLRRTLGMGPPEHNFHITFAIRKVNALRKAASWIHLPGLPPAVNRNRLV